MNHISANILSLSSEAALLVEKNRISYANPVATELLGSDCVDKFISEIFGAEFTGTQASSFIGDVPIKGRHYIVRVSKLDFGQIIFLSPSSTAPVCINDSFIFAAKDALNNINMAIETGRFPIPDPKLLQPEPHHFQRFHSQKPCRKLAGLYLCPHQSFPVLRQYNGNCLRAVSQQHFQFEPGRKHLRPC